MDIETIRTVEGFQSQAKAGSVLIHFDVDWAVQARESRKSVARLAGRIGSHPRLSGVRIYRVDCTEQEGALWTYLLEWCESNQLGNYLVYGGNGALIWLTDGQVQDSTDYAAKLSDDELLAKSVNAFAA